MRVDLESPHNYTVEIDLELPGTRERQEPEYEFPRFMAIGRVCMILRVTPDGGQTWIGRFWSTYGYGVTGVFSGTNETTLCAIAEGTAYIIPVLDPSHWIPVSIEPVVEVHRVPGNGKLLFVDWCGMAAYNATGKVWETERLSMDGLKVTQVEENEIQALGCDVYTDTWSPLVVDTRTGAVVAHRSHSSRSSSI